MKAPLIRGLAIATLLVAGSALPGFAQDATKQQPAPAAEPASPPPATNDTVPRPSIAPKTAEPAAAPAADNEPAPRHRHYAHRYRYHRYGYYRTAYWEPFPIYWPHMRHNRIFWNRIPWFVQF